MSFIELIGTDCMDIIKDYKIELDNYQKKLDIIERCSQDEEIEIDLTNNPILLLDFKEYYLKHNLTHRIRYQMRCYKYYTLDFNNIEDDVLENTKIIYLCKIEDSDNIYLQFDS